MCSISFDGTLVRDMGLSFSGTLVKDMGPKFSGNFCLLFKNGHNIGYLLTNPLGHNSFQ